MTACTNKGGKAGRVITAALVATLSVGAPVVALATTGDASGDISLMFTNESAAFSAGTPTWTLYHGNNSADGGTWAQYKKNVPVHLDVTKVTLKNSEDVSVDVTVTGDDYETTYYYRNDDDTLGDEVKGDITEVGKYYAVVTAVGGDYEGGQVKVPFEIRAIDISDVAIDGRDTFTYNAESHTDGIEFFLDSNGNGVRDNGETELVKDIDYTVEYYVAGHDTTDQWKSDVTDKGTYTAKITGIDGYTGSVTLTDVITVNALDLTAGGHAWTEDLASSSDQEPTAPSAIWIDGVRYGADSNIVKELKAEYVSGPSASWFNNGSYVYAVSAKDANDQNIINSQNFDALKVEQTVTFKYDDAAWPESYETIVKEGNLWNTSKVSAYLADGTEVPVAKYYVFNEDGKDCEADGIDWSKTPGKYTLVYRSFDNTDFTYGGVATTSLTVYEEALNADAQAIVWYGGKVVTSVEKTYDGNDVVPEISTYVEDEDGNPLIKGDDYFVKFYNADGTEVKKIVNAGTYTMKMTSDDYKLSGTTEMTITVNPMDLGTISSDKLVPAEFDKVGVANYDYLPWREGGYAIAPKGDLEGLGLHYLNENGTKVYLVSSGVANDLRIVITDESGTEVDKFVDEGVYTIKFEARNDDAKVNYVMPADLEILCAKKEHTLFADVMWDAYYADAVAFTHSHRIMTGYTDAAGDSTGRFGSADTLTRGQVAVILYNMASENEVLGSLPVYTPDHGYVTGFDDTDGFAYYAKAVAWCKQSGLIEGYVADNTFRPDQNITREEFATMLCNYEKAYGDYKAADESVIDKFADAGETSDWAVDDVAWAVEQGILLGNPSNELNPTDSILRAETAVMVYRYLG